VIPVFAKLARQVKNFGKLPKGTLVRIYGRRGHVVKVERYWYTERLAPFSSYFTFIADNGVESCRVRASNIWEVIED
jgi:hypothetical protein